MRSGSVKRGMLSGKKPREGGCKALLNCRENRGYTLELQFYDCVYMHLASSIVFRGFPNLYGSGKNAGTHSEGSMQFLQEGLRTHAVYEGFL